MRRDGLDQNRNPRFNPNSYVDYLDAKVFLSRSCNVFASLAERCSEASRPTRINALGAVREEFVLLEDAAHFELYQRDGNWIGLGRTIFHKTRRQFAFESLMICMLDRGDWITKRTIFDTSPNQTYPAEPTTTLRQVECTTDEHIIEDSLIALNLVAEILEDSSVFFPEMSNK